MQRRNFINVSLVGLCGLFGIKPVNGDILRPKTKIETKKRWQHIVYETYRHTLYIDGIKCDNPKDIPQCIQRWIRDCNESKGYALFYKMWQK